MHPIFFRASHARTVLHITALTLSSSVVDFLDKSGDPPCIYIYTLESKNFWVSKKKLRKLTEIGGKYD